MRSTSRSASLVAAVLLSAGAARAQAPAASAGPDRSRIRLEDFKKDLDAGRLYVIDVRSAETYRAGHIPGSFSVPLSALDQRLPELKAVKKPIVAYCA